MSEHRRDGRMRALALACGLVLTASYVSVLQDVTSVVGGTGTLFAVVAGALALATLLALAVSPRVAVLGATLLLVAGGVTYVEAVAPGWALLDNLGKVAADTVSLLTGVSVLRMQGAGAWALGFAPTPVFLSWYLFVRRRYALGVGVGGLALLVFVLTGDAGTTVTLVGVVAAAGALGVGELEWRGLTAPDVETLALVLSVMIVLTTTVSVVPAGGAGTPFLPGRGNPTVEGGVVDAGQRMSIVGSVSLSPEVRFTVESDRPAYWRVGAYDRYTGQGWVRSGQPRAYEGDLPGAGSGGDRIVQRVEVESSLSTIPAAWRPTAVDGDAEDIARVSSLGGLQSAGTLERGDTYTVTSQRPAPTETELRRADDDYPDAIEDRYTELPRDTPPRLDRFTDRLTDDVAGPYEAARRIESWLESNKNYSLDVRRPDDRIASSFVFDMERGYCTYFATAMVAMLRTQDVPARMVVGYTPGQRVAENRWVVRGYNAHAWVEVYFEDVGWVQFDPTPAGPRQAAEQERLQQARSDGEADVDVDDSEEGEWTPTPADTATPGPGETPDTPTPTGGVSTGEQTPVDPGFASGVTPTGTGGPEGTQGPSRELLALGFVVVVGLAAGVRRTRAVPRLRRLANTYWQRPSDDPGHDVRRAVERLEYVLAREYRPRYTGESHRAYLETVASLERDDRIRRVARIHERATYAGGVDGATAAEAVDLVDEVVRDHGPLLARLRRR